jgi:hypothetical protein
VLTLSGLSSIFESSTEVSFKKSLGTELFEIFVVIFKCGILSFIRV